MTKKRYEVCASYTLCATYYLDAESEEQAINLAKDNLRAVTTDVLAASYGVKTKYSAIKPEYIGEEIVVDSVEGEKMNKKELILDLIDEYASLKADEQTVIFNLLEFEDTDPPTELLEAKEYFSNKCDAILNEIDTLLTTEKYSNIKTFMVCIGWFFSIVLSIVAIQDNNVLMAGLAALFPFLIYLVRVDR